MNIPKIHSLRSSRQGGSTLLIGMVMLILISLLAVGVIRLTTQHTRIVNNEQFVTEATNAANYALDLVLNTPVTVWETNYAGTTGSTIYVNLGTLDTAETAANSMAVQVKNFACKRQRVKKNSEMIRTDSGTGLKYIPAADSSCFGGGGAPITITDLSGIGSPSDDSFCVEVLYEVEALAKDNKLMSAEAHVVQGVEVRRSIDEASNCN